MPIPPLESDYLPIGIHDCTVDEIKETFGTNEIRLELIQNLIDYIKEIHEIGICGWIIVNGSFITSEDDPSDIDIILIIGGDYSLLAPFTQKERNLIYDEYVKEKFQLHLIPTYHDDDSSEKWILFFSRIRGKPDIKKGLLRVTL